MLYYITNIKPEVLHFEKNQDDSGGRMYEFFETEDKRWALTEDCIKEIDERYSKETVQGMKSVSLLDAMKADEAVTNFNKMEILKDIKLKEYGTI
jgi:hypothetical protein